LLIGQLHYETTPKYNFPQLIREDEFKKIVEISLESMHTIKGGIFQSDSLEFPELLAETEQLENLAPPYMKNRSISTLLTPLKPIRDGTPIVGIDVSSIKIGATEAGAVYAVRGAIVLNMNGRYRFLRFGPLPFHVTKKSIREILKDLGEGLPFDFNFSPQIEPQSQLCNLIERWLQAYVSHLVKENIILWDGSLTSGISGSPTSELSRILKAARENSNIVMAFSKDTTVRFLEWRITDLLAEHKPPCLFEVDSLPLSSPSFMRFLGRIYVAKLAEGGCVFRLDIDKAIPRENCITAVERLLGNELVYQGYPETLRLAHIYSTFTASDVIGIQRFLAKNYGIKFIVQRNMHRTLFGPYGTRLGG